MIPNFKNICYGSLNKEQKLAMLERVAMDLVEYLKVTARNTVGLTFAQYWMEKATTIEPSTSPYLNFYLYAEGKGLCVTDDVNTLSVRYNVKECTAFINNVVNDIPMRSPIVDLILRGGNLNDLVAKGVLVDAYGSTLPKKEKVGKKGKPVDPNSLAQRIKRGEITRYEAYQKKYGNSEDDAL